jgi:hypothetical protein
MEKAEVIKRNIKEGIRGVRTGSVKCKCGCTVSYKFFNRYGWAVCIRCGNKVEKPKDEFKNKLESILKGSERYG